MAEPPRFAINPELDPVALGVRFAEAGRLQIADFLVGDGVGRLRAALLASSRWRLVINGTSQVFEIARADYERLPGDERARIEQAVHAAASSGFQFRFDTIRVPDGEDERRASATIVDAFASFLSAPETLAWIGRVTAARDIVFADAQATRYLAGDFLTAHDDDVAAKHRRLAYVLGLTPEWRSDWGGLLQFHGTDGGVVETMTPRFNALCLFAIGQPHSVSYVAPYTAQPRLSVTGWFRTQR